MRERWIMYYDGACPLCEKSKNRITSMLSNIDIKLTSVDLNHEISRSKGYTANAVVLETPNKTYIGKDAWIKILSHTKYNWISRPIFSPILTLGYKFITKNRKSISKLIKI